MGGVKAEGVGARGRCGRRAEFGVWGSIKWCFFVRKNILLRYGGEELILVGVGRLVAGSGARQENKVEGELGVRVLWTEDGYGGGVE